MQAASVVGVDSEDFEYVVDCFSSLSVDRVRSRYTADVKHKAPHKPLLLLAILQLIDEGEISTPEISPSSSELIEAFLHYVAIVPQGRKLVMALPFFHMKSEPFWELKDHAGDNLQSKGTQLRSMGLLRDVVSRAVIEERVWKVISDKKARTILRQNLIETHFSESAKYRLLEQHDVNIEANQYSVALLRMQADAERMLETRAPVRDQGFRRAVQMAYEHRCAFTGLQLVTPDYHTAIDAAHIIPWSESHDDRVQNGMALSKLCHWAFDEGLLGVNESGIIRVSPYVRRSGHRVGHLLDLDEREIHRPASEAHQPDSESFAWHMKNKFTHR